MGKMIWYRCGYCGKKIALIDIATMGNVIISCRKCGKKNKIILKNPDKSPKDYANI